MAPWTLAAAYECAVAQSMDPLAATKKGLHKYGGDTSSCPGPYPMAACPEFHLGCRLGRYSIPTNKQYKILIITTITLPICCPVSMEPWAVTKSLSRFLPNGHLSRVSCRLGQELFTLPICCRQCPGSHGLVYEYTSVVVT